MHFINNNFLSIQNCLQKTNKFTACFSDYLIKQKVAQTVCYLLFLFLFDTSDDGVL